MTPRLTLCQLTKRFGAMTALDQVSFQVGAGQRVALLGHNGAGKSTLMKIVLGLIPFDGGEVAVAGAAPGSATARRVTAYLPENAAFHPALTGRQMVAHYLRLRGQHARLAGDLLDRVGLSHAADRRIGTYSKGMRQRVGLAQALIGQPDLMILDEPTSGLDPVSRRDFYALLDDLAAQGTAILLSSHALTEVEARTDQILILSRGVLVAQGTMADLRRRAGLPVTIAVTPAPEADLAARLPQARVERDHLLLSVPLDRKMAVLAELAALGGLIADIDIQPPSLEDIYSRFSAQAASPAAEAA